MEYRVLGPLTVLADGRPMKLGGRRQQLVLATLLTRANLTVSQELMIDNVWAGEPPEAAKSTLQSYVYGLRRVLGADAIVRQGEGYRVDLDRANFDAMRFEEMVTDGRRLIGTDPEEASKQLTEALALWRGSPYEGLDSNPTLLAEITRLDELRLSAIEVRIEAELTIGDHAEVVGELDSLVHQHPFRERFRAQQMLALYRSGRQADALRAYQLTRLHLAEELGIDPSPELQELEQRILQQDSSLNPNLGDLRAVADQSGSGELRGYEIEEVIGQGDFGTVYRARHSAVQREVAVKVIKPEYASESDFVRRFEREARIVAQLDHPHIVPLYDFWRDPEGAYLVMPLMRGGSLESEVGERGWPLSRVLGAIDQVGGALSHAHRRGVVHRDVKPANVLLDSEGNCYLSDFGIARSLEVHAPMIDARSPQRARSHDEDFAPDILGLGYLTFQLLSGVTTRTGWPLPRLTDARPDLPPELGRVLARATSADPMATFQRVDDFVRALKQAVGADVVPPSLDVEEVREPIRNPYKGLRAFRDADAADFFGRDALVDELLEALTKQNVVTVVGPSGSGKSSLVRAGLIPALRARAISGFGDWLVTDMFPGSHPFEELEAALLKVAVERPSNLLAELSDEDGLLRVSKRILPSEDTTLLVLVDQFEELFSTVQSETARRAFLDNLVAVASDERSRVKVVLTLRADYLDRPLSYQSFADVIGRGMVTVGPPSRDGLAQAIAGPALAVNVEVEPGLIGRMISDIENQPGALPLLQFALTELFESHEDGSLSIARYESIGGVRQALGLRAEELYADMTAPMQHDASQIFLRLVTVTEDNEATRRRISQAELRRLSIDPETIDLILGRFASVRLLSFDRDPVTRAPTVELAHEAIVTEWARLQSWVEDHRETLIEGRRISGLTRDWVVSDSDPSFLLRGSRLHQAQEWVETTELALTHDEELFVEASSEVERAESRATRRRRRVTTYGLVAALGVFMVLSFVALGMQNSARTEARHALVRDLASDAVSAIDQDPELGMLLALEAADISIAAGEPLDSSTMNALHAALGESRLERRLDDRVRAVELAGPVVLTITPEWTVAAESLSGGEQLWTVGEGSQAYRIAASPDGTLVAAAVLPAGKPPEVVVWSINGPEEKMTFQTPSRPAAIRLAWSPDGRILAVLTRLQSSAKVSLFDVTVGAQVTSFEVENGHDIVAVDADTFAVSSPDAGEVGFYSLDGSRLDKSIGTPGFAPGTLAYDPGGDRLVLGSTDGKRAQIWDVASQEMLWEAVLPHPGAWSTVIDVSPETGIVAISANNGVVTLFDLSDGSEQMTLKGHLETVIDLDFDVDGEHLVSSAISEVGRIWNVSPGGLQGVTAGHEAPCRLLISPDGSTMTVTGTDGTLTIVDVATGEVLRSLPNQGIGYGEWAIVSGDGRLMSWVDQNGWSRIWNAETLQPVSELPPCSIPKALSHDGSLLVAQVNCSAVKRGSLIDTRTGEELFDLGEGEVYDAVFTSANGTEPSRYVVLDRQGSFDIYDTQRGQLVVVIEWPKNEVGNSFAVDKSGSQLAVGYESGAASVYSLPKLVSGSPTDEAVEVNIETTGSVFGIAVEGAYLATSTSGLLQVWDIATGTLVAQPHLGIVTPPFATFSPDGMSLMYADGEYEARRLILDPDELIKQAALRLTRELTQEECNMYLGPGKCGSDAA